MATHSTDQAGYTLVELLQHLGPEVPEQEPKYLFGNGTLVELLDALEIQECPEKLDVEVIEKLKESSKRRSELYKRNKDEFEKVFQEEALPFIWALEKGMDVFVNFNPASFKKHLKKIGRNNVMTMGLDITEKQEKSLLSGKRNVYEIEVYTIDIPLNDDWNEKDYGQFRVKAGKNFPEDSSRDIVKTDCYNIYKKTKPAYMDKEVFQIFDNLSKKLNSEKLGENTKLELDAADKLELIIFARDLKYAFRHYYV
jgi:hypothetical protein